MEALIEVGTKVKHSTNSRIGEVLKINAKTYLVKTLKEGYTTIYENLLFKKDDCVSYVEPVKEKTFYEIYRERTIEMAKKLPKFPKETSQAILWLKSAIIEKVNTSDKDDSKIYTFRKKEGDNDFAKFGFSEEYVNLLMEMAYDEGRRRATDELTQSYNRSTTSMKAALDKVKDALDDADWIEYNNYE